MPTIHLDDLQQSLSEAARMLGFKTSSFPLQLGIAITIPHVMTMFANRFDAGMVAAYYQDIRAHLEDRLNSPNATPMGRTNAIVAHATLTALDEAYLEANPSADDDEVEAATMDFTKMIASTGEQLYAQMAAAGVQFR